MTDPAREGLLRLMVEIGELEESVEELQRTLRAASRLPVSRDGEAAQRELRALVERLDRKRSELTRISNACRRPHAKL
jgi:hypothetical protein